MDFLIILPTDNVPGIRLDCPCSYDGKFWFNIVPWTMLKYGIFMLLAVKSGPCKWSHPIQKIYSSLNGKAPRPLYRLIAPKCVINVKLKDIKSRCVRRRTPLPRRPTNEWAVEMRQRSFSFTIASCLGQNSPQRHFMEQKGQRFWITITTV